MALRIERPVRRAGDGTSLAEHVGRVSWGAIIAGAACALALQIVFTLMTAGLGLSLVSDGSGEGAGWGSGLFFALTAVASLFAGGWIAGRLSNEGAVTDATLHGIVVWALVMIGVTWLGVSATGAALRGAGQVVQATGQAAGSVASGVGGAVGDAVSAVAPDMEAIEAPSLESLLPASVEQDLRAITGNQNLTPEALRQQATEIFGAVIDEEDLTEARNIAVGAGREMLRNPGEAAAIFDAAVERMTAPEGPLGEAQLDELQGALQARYGLSPAESEEIATRWRGEFVDARDAAIATYREAYDEAAQAVNEAVDAAAEAAQAAAETAASVAWWSAFGGFLGLLAAAAGAAFGRPDDHDTTRTTVVTPPAE